MAEGEQWTYSSNDEYWPVQDTYDTREEARKAGIQELALDVVNYLYTGRCEKLDIDVLLRNALDGEHVFDRLSEAAYEEVGEVSEDWPAATGIADFERVLTAAASSWFKAKKERLPSFVKIVDMERYTVTPDDLPEEART